MNFENSSNVLKRCASLNNLLIQNHHLAPTMNAAQPTSSTSTREPTNFSNIFTHRTRRFSASYSNNSGLISPSPGSPCLAPRVSQLRQEECAEVSNQRELNHEREIHSALLISQSCDDLTLITENWSVKNHDDLTNPLHVALPSTTSCSSPSPTSRHNTRLPCVSPSPTRRTFSTRRSMSPIAIRPSPLSSIKRKFDMIDDPNSSSSSTPPFKKMFSESYSRGSSPSYQIQLSPSPVCPSPDSSSAFQESNGRLTPKIFVSKILNNTNANSLSSTSSPLSTFSSENDSSPSPSLAQTTLMELGSSDDAVLSQSEVSSSDNNVELTEAQNLTLNMEMDSVSSSQIVKSDDEKSSAPEMIVDESVSSNSNEKLIESIENEFLAISSADSKTPCKSEPPN